MKKLDPLNLAATLPLPTDHQQRALAKAEALAVTLLAEAGLCGPQHGGAYDDAESALCAGDDDTDNRTTIFDAGYFLGLAVGIRFMAGAGQSAEGGAR